MIEHKKDAQTNGRDLADCMMRYRDTGVSLPEQIQYLLSYAADTHNQLNHPYGVATVQSCLEALFDVLEPEEVVL